MYKRLVADVSTLLSLPEVYLRLRDLLGQPSTNAKNLGEVISLDPSLAARLLKVVNSSFYGFLSKIEDLDRAITIIGIHDLENLVLAASASDVFDKIPSEFIDMSCFWHHSVYVGITAKLLGKHCGFMHPERLFAAGLLHDVGQLILFNKEPNLARQALEQALPSDDGLYHAEQQVFGFTHGDIGAELFRVWQLPAIFTEVAAFHHEPRRAKNCNSAVAIIHLANSLVNTVEPARNITECSPTYDPEAFNIAALSQSVLDNVLTEAELQFQDVIKIISPNTPLL
ncbi:MAG: HDOD domain-containing protein [Methyloprofundus sp.]|nr:HDOD domain-containing protein [Methyloprofundus sp.]MDT8426305.1 HDOD domain-containing protein [Methyloprofundus sp.]